MTFSWSQSHIPVAFDRFQKPLKKHVKKLQKTNLNVATNVAEQLELTDLKCGRVWNVAEGSGWRWPNWVWNVADARVPHRSKSQVIFPLQKKGDRSATALLSKSLCGAPSELFPTSLDIVIATVLGHPINRFHTLLRIILCGCMIPAQCTHELSPTLPSFYCTDG